MSFPTIVLPGGAGLVGQNLIVRLKARGFHEIVVLDKHTANVEKLRSLHPDICVELVDLAKHGDWERHLNERCVLVMLQAQIGAKEPDPFVRNNVESTRVILEAMRARGVPYFVHVSSSVVESVANDHYTRTKREQEALVEECGIPHITLRPTLMFGWFDRKHLGWLARFMKRVPIFPIPGHGRYSRQPLYVGDFCDVILRCIEQRRVGSAVNITGFERIDYVDMIRAVREACGARCLVVHLPYHLFDVLLRTWAWFDANPPFTTDQLRALTAGDEFEVIDWPSIFATRATPLREALAETYNHPIYSNVVLDF